jgi:hypothetical protein
MKKDSCLHDGDKRVCPMCDQETDCSMDLPCGWIDLEIGIGIDHDEAHRDSATVCSLKCAHKFLANVGAQP